ncbi:MAG: pyridoxal phosphate-dependent aminotransferase [Candidatus Hydrogenedentes bacterium]|nr:pyridoxal phosphate-dependent aminotransferase [Candidatus Hydrogenedentota bacterium]
MSTSVPSFSSLPSLPIVDIGKGEPDFHTPDHIKRAAHEAIDANFTKYTPQPGIDALREAVAAKFEGENGIRVSPADVVVSCGGKHSVEQAIRATIGPGDEAVILTPHWFAYPHQVHLAGGRPVLVPLDETHGYAVNATAVRRAITPKTRLLIINSPANPTGAVFSRVQLTELAALAVEHGLLVLSDEVYERLVYEGAEHVSIASLDDDIASRTITVNSVSKTHAMTGWRIGYAALPDNLARRVTGIQQNSTSAPCAISQRAALAALTGTQEHVERMVAAYAARRNLLLRLLKDIPEFSSTVPAGTFYCFVNMAAWIGRVLNKREIRGADDFAAVLLDAARVRVVPATEFGSEKHIRLSFAVSEEALQEGLGRVKSLLS